MKSNSITWLRLRFLMKNLWSGLPGPNSREPYPVLTISNVLGGSPLNSRVPALDSVDIILILTGSQAAYVVGFMFVCRFWFDELKLSIYVNLCQFRWILRTWDDLKQAVFANCPHYCWLRSSFWFWLVVCKKHTFWNHIYIYIFTVYNYNIIYLYNVWKHTGSQLQFPESSGWSNHQSRSKLKGWDGSPSNRLKSAAPFPQEQMAHSSEVVQRPNCLYPPATGAWVASGRGRNITCMHIQDWEVTSRSDMSVQITLT